MAAIKEVSKSVGRVYTPRYIVENILDMVGYVQNKIDLKHVMDNSCGDGAFLSVVVERYCEQSIKQQKNKAILKRELELYIHGIDMDEDECIKCQNNLSSIAMRYGVFSVDWNIVCADSLEIQNFSQKMDFVVGNPPYIRVHNLDSSYEKVKSLSFNKDGMTDLYISFYEIGLNMLNDTGTLGYITPSSFFTSIAGLYMRKYFVDNKLIKSVVDLGHFQAFKSTTYTAIVILNKSHCSDKIDYYKFDEKNLIPYFVETLRMNDYFIDSKFCFSDKAGLDSLKRIMSNGKNTCIEVKNGYATLCDKVFVNDFDFESNYVIPVIKASKGEVKKIIFPYDVYGNLVSENCISEDKNVYDYLLRNRDLLQKRSSDNENNGWYSFGRSQAIRDTYKDKISINTMIRDYRDLKIVDAPAGVGVYSGLYILPHDISTKNIKSALLSEEFSNFVKLLGKYKNGGYYTFSSKDVKLYLDYKMCQENKI